MKPTYKDGWDIPGGYVNKGESPRAAAIREVKEELGVDWPIGNLLVVDWAPHPDEGDKILFVFDGMIVAERVNRSVVLNSDELSTAQWKDVETVDQLLPMRLATRVQAACAGAGTYLEHGRQF